MNEWRADEALVAVLHDAVRRDNDEIYLATLLDICLVMPGDGEWVVGRTQDGDVVFFFSSVDLLRASPGCADVPFVVWPVLDLVRAWPNRTWSLLVDGTHPSQVLIEPDVIAQLADRAAEAYPLDAALTAANGHPRSCLKALVRSEVVVPMRPKGSPSRDTASADFAWWHTSNGDADQAVALFSSPVRLQASLGDVPWLVAPFVEIVRHWPDGCAADIDPTHHIGVRLPAEAMAAMAVALYDRHTSGETGRADGHGRARI